MTSVLLVRHGPARDKAAWAKAGKPDEERPLTDAGRVKTRRAMRGLAKAAPELSIIASSPLLRALDTAGLLAKSVKNVKRVVAPELSPESPPQYALDLLARLGKAAALVGHEPHLSEVLKLATGAGPAFRLELKKGGAALVEFEGAAEAGRGRLAWLLSPSQLRALA